MEEDTREEQPLESDVKPSLMPQEQGSQKKKKKLADKKEPQTAVRKSSRPRKQSKRVLDSADCNDEKIFGEPPRKRHRKLVLGSEKDTLSNDKPFSCSLCESPQINNHPGKARIKHVRQPIIKEKDGQLLQLCVKCAMVVGQTESKVATLEQKAEFEEEGKRFAQQLAQRFNDEDASSLYCSSYYTTKCGCIQSYIHGSLTSKKKRSSISGSEGSSSVKNEPSEEEAKPSIQPTDETERANFLLSLLKEAKAWKATLKQANVKRKRKVSEEKVSASKEYEKFVMTNRNKLRNLGMCERGCQRLLCYSNNFLHKKAVGRQPRVQRVKGRAALGQLQALEELPKLRCCDKSCVQVAESNPEEVAQWRKHAQKSQKEMWRVITEMLSPDDPSAACCHKFITMVTGCCTTTAQKVHGSVLLSKRTSVKWAHGMRDHWEKQKGQSKKEQSKKEQNKKEQNKLTKASSSKGSGTKSESTIFILNSAASPVATMTTSSHASTTASPLSVIPASSLTSVPASPLTFVSNPQVISLTVPSLLPLAGQGNTATVNNLGSPLVSQVIPQLLSANPQHLIAAPQYLPVAPQQHQEQQQHHQQQQQQRLPSLPISHPGIIQLGLPIESASNTHHNLAPGVKNVILQPVQMTCPVQVVTTFVTEAVTGTAVTTVTSAVPSMVVSSRASVSEAVTESKHQVASPLGAVIPQETSGQTSQGHSTVEVRQERDREVEEGSRDIRERVLQLCEQITDPQDLVAVQKMLADFQKNLAKSRTDAEEQGSSSQQVPQPQPVAASPSAAMSVSITAPSKSSVSLPTSFTVLQENSTVNVHSLKAGRPFVHIRVPQKTSAESSSASGHHVPHTQMECAATTNSLPVGSSALTDAHPAARKARETIASFGVNSQVTQATSLPFQLTNQASKTVVLTGNNSSQLIGFPQVTLPFVMINSSASSLTVSPQTSSSSVTSIVGAQVPQQVGAPLTRRITDNSETSTLAPTAQVLSVLPSASPAQTQPASTGSVLQPVPPQLLPTLVTDQPDLTLSTAQPTARMSYIVAKQPRNTSQGINSVSHAQSLASLPSVSGNYPNLSSTSAQAMQQPSLNSSVCIQRSQDNVQVFTNSPLSLVPSALPEDTSLTALPELLHSHSSSGHAVSETPRARQNLSFVNTMDEKTASTSSESPSFQTNPAVTMQNGNSGMDVGPQNNSTSQHNMNGNIVSEMYSSQGLELSHQGTGIDHLLSSSVLVHPLGNFPVGTPSSCSSGSFVFDALADSPVKDGSLNLSPSSQPIPVVPTSSLLCEMLMRPNVMSLPVATSTTLSPACSSSSSSLSSTGSSSLSSISLSSLPSSSSTAIVISVPDFNFSPVVLTTPHVSPLSTNVSCSSSSGISTPHTLCQSLNSSTITTPSTMSSHIVTAIETGQEPRSSHTPVAFTIGHNASLSQSQLKLNRVNRHKDPPQVGIVHPHVSAVKGSSTTRTSAGPSNSSCSSGSSNSSSSIIRISNAMSLAPACVTVSSRAVEPFPSASGRATIEQPNLSLTASPNVAPFVENQNDQLQQQQLQQSQLLLNMYLNSGQTTNLNSQVVTNQLSAQGSQINLSALFGTPDVSPSHVISPSAANTFPNIIMQSGNQSTITDNAAASQNQNSGSQAGITYLTPNQTVIAGDGSRVANSNVNAVQQMANSSQLFQTVVCPNTGQIKLVPVIMSSEASGVMTTPSQLSQNGQLILSMSPLQGLNTLPNLSPQILSRDGNSSQLNLSPNLSQFLSNTEQPLDRETQSGTVVNSVSSSAQANTQNLEFVQILSNQRQTSQGGPVMLNSQPASAHSVIHNELVHAFSQANDKHSSPAASISGTNQQGLPQHAQPNFRNSQATAAVQSSHNSSQSAITSMQASQGTARNPLPAANQIAEPMVLNVNGVQQYQTVPQLSVLQEQVLQAGTLAQGLGVEIQPQVVIQSQNWSTGHQQTASLGQVNVQQQQQAPVLIQPGLQLNVAPSSMGQTASNQLIGQPQILQEHAAIPIITHGSQPNIVVQTLPSSQSVLSVPADSSFSQASIGNRTLLQNRNQSSPWVNQVSPIIPLPNAVNIVVTGTQTSAVQSTKNADTSTTSSAIHSSIARSEYHQTSTVSSTSSSQRHRPIMPKLAPVAAQGTTSSPSQKFSVMLVPNQPGNSVIMLDQEYFQNLVQSNAIVAVPPSSTQNVGGQKPSSVPLPQGLQSNDSTVVVSQDEKPNIASTASSQVNLPHQVLTPVKSEKRQAGDQNKAVVMKCKSSPALQEQITQRQFQPRIPLSQTSVPQEANIGGTDSGANVSQNVVSLLSATEGLVTPDATQAVSVYNSQNSLGNQIHNSNLNIDPSLLGQAQTFLTQAGSILITSTNSLQQGPLSFPQAQVISLQNESSAAINSSESLRQAMSLIGSGSDVSQEGSQILSQDISGNSGGISDQQAYSKQPFASHVGTLSLQTINDPGNVSGLYPSTHDLLSTTTVRTSVAVRQSSSSSVSDSSQAVPNMSSSPVVTVASNTGPQQILSQKPEQLQSSHGLDASLTLQAYQSTSAGLSSQNLPASLERQGIRLQTSQSTNVASKSGLVVSCGENPKTYTVAISGSELASAGLHNVNQRTETASNTNSAGLAPLTVALGLNTTQVVNKSEVKSSVASTCIPFHGTRPSSSQLMLHLVQPVAGSLPAVATTMVSTNDTQSQDEPIQYLRSNEVIDLTDDSPPPTPSRSLTNLDRLSRVTKQAQQPPQSTLLLEELQKQIPPHTVVATQQNQLQLQEQQHVLNVQHKHQGQLYQENANPQRSAAQDEVGESSNSGHQPSTQMATGSSHSQFLNLDDIPATMRQALIASLEAHAAGNPDVQLVTRTLAPSDGLTHQDFLPSGLESQQMQAQVSELSKAISKNKCLSAVVTISTSQRFQQGLAKARSQAQDPAMTVTATAQDNRTEQAVPVSRHDGSFIQPVPQQMVVCSVNQPSSSVQATLSNNVLPINVSMMSYTPSQTSIPLPTSSAAVAAMLSGQSSSVASSGTLFPTQTASVGTPLMSAAPELRIGCSPSHLSASLGRSAVHPLTSSSVTFTRTSNMPNDAVGPPNITIMSPTRANPSPIRRVRQDSISGVAAPVFPSPGLPVASPGSVPVDTRSPGLSDVQRASGTPELVRIHKSQTAPVSAAKMAVSDGRGLVFSQAQGRQSMPAVVTTSATSVEMVTNTAGSSTQAGERCMAPKESQKKSKPRTRASTVMDLLRKKEQQESAEASSASSGVPVSNTSGPVTLMFSSDKAGAPKLFVVGAKPGQQDTESQTLQNTVKNLQLIGPLTSSTAAATTQQSGFTILQPRMMQLPNTSVSNVFQSAPTTTVTLADQIAGCVTQVLTVSSEKLQQKPVFSSITTASQAHQIPLSSTAPAAAANIPLVLGSPAVTKVLLTSRDTVSSQLTVCSVSTNANRQTLDGETSMVASGATQKVMNASHQSKQEDKDLPQAQLIGQPPVVSIAHQQGVDSSILNLLGSQKDQGLRVQTQGSAEEALQLKSVLNQSQGSQNYTKRHKFTLSQNPPGYTFVENYASQDASSGMGNVKRLLLSSSSPVVSDSDSKSSSSMVTGVAEGGSQALSSLDHMMSMKSPQLLQLMKSNTGPQVNPNTSGHIIPHAKSPDQSTLKLTSAVRQTPDSTWTSQKSRTTQLEEGIALDTKITPGGSQRPLLLIRPKTSVEQTSMKISSTESDLANRSSTQSMRSRLPSANPLLATILFAGPNARSASSPVAPGVSSSATSSVMVQPAVDTPQRAGVAEDMVRGSASLHPVTTMGNFNVVYNLHPQHPPRNTLQESLEKPSGLIEGESLKDQIDQHMKGDLELASKNPNNPPMATFQQVPPAYVQPPRYDVAARELKQAEYTNLAMRLRSPPQYEAATRSETTDRPHSKNNTSLPSETHPVQSGRIEKVIEDIYKFPDEGDEPSPPPVLGGLKSHNIGQKFRFTPAGAILSHRRLSDIPEQAGDTILGQTSETGLESGSRKGNKTSHEVLNNEFGTVDHLRAPSKPSESASVVFSEAEPSAPLWKSPKKVKGKRDTGKVSGKINSKKVQFSDVVTSKSVPDYGQTVGVNTSSRLTSADGLVVHTTSNKNLAWSEESPYLSSRDYIPSVTDGDQAKICRLDSLALVQRGDVPSESSRAEVRDCRLKALLSSESSAQRGRTASSTGTHQEPGLYYVPREDLGHRDSNSELLYYQQGHDAEDGPIYSYLPRVISRGSETSTGLELASRHTTERMSYETAHEAVGYTGQAHPSGVSFTPEGPAGLRTKQKVVPGHDTGAVASETYSQFGRSERSKEMMGRRLAPVDEDTPQNTVAGHLLDLGKAPHASDIRSQQATSQDEREYMKESDGSVSFDRPSSFNILSRQGYSKLHRQRLSRLQSDQDAADDSTLSSVESSRFSVHSQGSVTETSNSSDHFEMVRNSPQMPRWPGRTESVPGHLISASGDAERRPSESPLHRQRMLESNFELARQMDHTVKDGRSENQRLESPQKFIGHSVRRLEGSTDNYLPRDGDYNSVLRDSEHRALSTQGSTLNTPVFMEQLEGRGGIDLNDDILSTYTHLTREIHSFMAINQKLKHEVAKAEQLQQRQRQQSTADKQQSPMMDVDLGEKSLYSSPSASTSQSHYTDNESMVPLRKRHSSSGILKRSPLPDAELLRLDEGGTTRSRHPSLTNAGIRQMLDSDIGPQDGHPRGSSAGHSYPKAGYSGDDHSGSDHFTRGQRDPLVSSSSLSRPSSQMEMSSPQSEIVRHRYPSSEMKPLFSRSNLEEAAFIPLDHTRHRNLSSSLGLRASSDLDPPPYDSSHRQRNPSASSLKSTFPPLTDAEFLNFDLGTRSRNPSSSSWMRYMDILQDSNLSAIRSRNPSGSSNRRSRPGSSSSDREFPVNMDELPMFTEYVRTRSRNSSGESIEPTMELLLDPQQILHVYNSACPRQNRH